MRAKCSIENCERPACGRSLCNRHYHRWRRHGDPRMLLRIAPPRVRFWRYVIKGDRCWIWIGALDSHGYGAFHVARNKTVKAYRFAYETMKGTVPVGKELDHLCRVPACVNPDHLEAVTHLENSRRGAQNAKTHCPLGHPYDLLNTYFGKSGRQCRSCRSRWLK